EQGRRTWANFLALGSQRRNARHPPRAASTRAPPGYLPRGSAVVSRDHDGILHPTAPISAAVRSGHRTITFPDRNREPRTVVAGLPGEDIGPELRREAPRDRRHQLQQEHEALTRRHPPPCDPAVCAAPRLCLDPARPRGQQPDRQQHHSPQPARQALDAPPTTTPCPANVASPSLCPLRRSRHRDTVTLCNATCNRVRISLTVVSPSPTIPVGLSITPSCPCVSDER